MMNGSEAMEVEQKITKLPVKSSSELTISDLTTQIRKIQEVMQSVMKKDEHYGLIPGTPKPSLYKPGAEKLGLTFMLKPRFKITKTDMDNGHREYEVLCELVHTPSGTFQGEGVGSCSTMESKFRFRWDNTGKEVPKEYWANRDLSLLGGDQFVARKRDNQWLIFQRVEHDNPADYYNTVLKMAKKRAHVDAMLTATAASDIFSQDIEDLPEFQEKPQQAPESVSNASKKEEGNISARPQSSPQGAPGPQNDMKLTFAQKKGLLRSMVMQLSENDEQSAKAYLKNLTKSDDGKYKGIELIDQIKTEKQCNYLIGQVEPMFIKEFGNDAYEETKTIATTNLL